MSPETIQTLGIVLGALLGGGIVKAVLDYVTARKTTRIDYSESVAKTLAELNDRLKLDLKEVRAELAVERSQRRTLEEQLLEQRAELMEERRLRKKLEARVQALETENSE